MYFSSQFDRSYDVVVIGAGTAGASAAISAHEAGAEVLVVDKQPAEGRRPNSRYAAGYFVVPRDVDGAAAYLRAMYAVNGELSDVDPALVRTWAAETALNPQWLALQGAPSGKVFEGGEHTTLDGHESIDIHRGEWAPGTPVTGCPVFTALDRRMAALGIDVAYGATARWLLTDAGGTVTGVQVCLDGQTLAIRAGRGVVLAAGGYEFDARLKRQYLPMTPVHFYGSPANTGAGVTMATEVGAELWHMNTWPGYLVAHQPATGYPGGLPIDLWAAGGFAAPPGADLAGGFFADGSGRRFTREPGRQHTLHLEVAGMDARRLVRPRIPAWWVFDERRRVKGPLLSTRMGPAGPVGNVAWSGDNLAEIDRQWVRRAPTVRALAALCGMDPDALERTVAAYNAACASGVDGDFGRPAHTLTPLADPPYYALALWPGGSNTNGGPRRDPDARVWSVRGAPIPGLYSAGELGSMYGLLYPAGGGSIAECLAFGRIAGRNAATRKPD
ncbi:FAD-dependent oxidoreductase [Phytohabitans sp. ZYX-F-186]|uniref:FAD-dependent oxidoreductase n=1 Tax=Phytohabitans maris TaxID=3071409 RepID=A0ABU0ZT81_9ACTN|nr:FAD-dependent oxidoreductase [Phytohabitans sp. ZYX-F-186]MDQ7910163.1 FAD-dependent oxidoreductase [Phytohabitans sp. ZYX-F-186]